MRRGLGKLFAASAMLAIAACGPIEYASDVARHATDAVEAARVAGAEKYAPYWWTRAVEYLHEAKLIAGYADFQGANRFGRLATESAEHAAAEAAAAMKDPSKRPLDVEHELAPAKPSATDDAPPVPAKSTKLAPVKDEP
jgi:sRNA-binding protein